MNEQSDSFQKTFFISQKHLDFLNRINENSSLALRTILDSIMNGDRYDKRVKRLDNLLIRVSLGFILILISYILQQPLLGLISILCGVFILSYAIFREVFDAVQLSRFKR